MKKEISFGKVGYSSNKKVNEITIEIELKNRQTCIDYETLLPLENVPVLTVCGNVWNSKKTDCEMAGQCLDELKDLLQTNKLFSKIHSLWTKYHLNDMHAGTKRQEEEIEKWRKENNLTGWQFNRECEYLKSINLHEDRGFEYGNGRLYASIPENDLKEIESIING